MFAATVDLPTPPLPLAIATICLTPAKGAGPGAAAWLAGIAWAPWSISSTRIFSKFPLEDSLSLIAFTTACFFSSFSVVIFS